MAAIVSNATMLAEYPEFNGATVALVTAKIAAAARATSSTTYPTDALAADAVMMKAALFLIISPYGRNMRSENPDAMLALEYRLKGLQRSSMMGLRVF